MVERGREAGPEGRGTRPPTICSLICLFSQPITACVHMYTHTHTHINTYTASPPLTSVCTYTYIHIHMYVLHICVHTCSTYNNICVPTYTHIHTILVGLE